jgi:hypothetical protein
MRAHVNIHRLATLALSTACVLAAGLLADPSAQALESRNPIGSPFGSFALATGITVDQTVGNVLVADSGGGELNIEGNRKGEVQVFGPEGQETPLDGVPHLLNGEHTPSLEFNLDFEPAGVSVDPASRDLYVSAVRNQLVDKFTLNGAHEYEFACQFINIASGNDCTNQAAVKERGFGTPSGVAIDSAHDLYIAASRGESIYEFNPAGEHIDTFNSSLLGSPRYLAVATDGTIYATGFKRGVLVEFKRSSPTGPVVESPKKIGENVGGVAYDQTTGHLLYIQVNGFVQESGGQEFTLAEVVELDAANNVVGSFGAGAMVIPDEGSSVTGNGIAVGEANGDAYVAAGKHVLRFGPVVLMADVTTGGSSKVGRAAATVEGSVNPDGMATTYHFQYGKSALYGSSTATIAVGEGNTAVPVSADLTGLTAATTYHYRLVGESANGASYGHDKEFMTSVAVEGVQTEPATDVQGASATLNGSLEPNGFDTHYWFEYAEGQGQWSRIPAAPGLDAGTAFKAEHVEVALPGLKSGTEYRYRLVAENSFGKTYAPNEVTFKTKGEGVKTEPATEIQARSATLNGSFEPNGVDTHYWFEYGPTKSYGHSTPVGDGGDATEVKRVSASVLGLAPNETYHYRIVTERGLVKEPGQPDESFKTLAVPPEVESLTPAFVGFETAVLSGLVNPLHSETTYYFEYGPCETPAPSETQQEACAKSPLPSSTVTQKSSIYGVLDASREIEGLLPSSVYHYRLIASISAGVTVVNGPPEVMFTTKPAPPLVVESGAAIATAQTSAVISGAVDPNGLAVSYGFQLGTQAGVYGPAIGLGRLGFGVYEPRTVTLALDDLQPGATYHYRLVASTAYATVAGPDEIFTTAGVSSPFTQPLAPPLLATPAIAFPNAVQPLTNAQKLANALKACRKKPMRQRSSCERNARKKYATGKKARRSGLHGKGARQRMR